MRAHRRRQLREFGGMKAAHTMHERRHRALIPACDRAPRGRAKTWAKERLAQTHRPNGQADVRAPLGSLIRADEAGRVRQFAYDSNSGVLSTTGLTGEGWNYACEGIAAGDISVSIDGGNISLGASQGEGDVCGLGRGGVTSSAIDAALRQSRPRSRNASVVASARVPLRDSSRVKEENGRPQGTGDTPPLLPHPHRPLDTLSCSDGKQPRSRPLPPP